MDQKFLMAPWCPNRQKHALRVKTVKVAAALPWSNYYKYPYLNGVGIKLHTIPRHVCGNEDSAIEQLERAQRLIRFVDVTGCRPIGQDRCPQSHTGITLIEDPDHLSYWSGPEGKSLVLAEPYACRGDLISEIADRGLTAIVLPGAGVYGGGGGKTVSVLMAKPESMNCLEKLAPNALDLPYGDVQDVNWFEALNMGKGRQS
jgi:hypothetical protein